MAQIACGTSQLSRAVLNESSVAVLLESIDVQCIVKEFSFSSGPDPMFFFGEAGRGCTKNSKVVDVDPQRLLPNRNQSNTQ